MPSDETLTTTALFPHSLDDVKTLYTWLRVYETNHFTWLLLAFSYTYLFKQTFSIPGSALLNALAGGLFGLARGWPLVCFLTACGASGCYTLSRIFGYELATYLYPKRMEQFRKQVQEQQRAGQLFWFLLSARLFPGSPNFLLNLCSPLVGVPFVPFFFSVLFGLMPYNFVCVQAGTMLATLTSLDEVLTAGTMGKLGLLALLVLSPALVRWYRGPRDSDKLQ